MTEGARAAESAIRGYHILEDRIAWGFAREGEPICEGELTFPEIVEAGPTAVLLFGVLAQLGAYQSQLDAQARALEDTGEAMTACAHALIEVAKKIAAAPVQAPTSDEIFERAEGIVDRLMTRAMNRAATTARVTTRQTGG